MSYKVVNVIAYDDYTLGVVFENNEQRKFDIKPYLNKGIFKALNNITYFKQVRVCGDSIRWPDGQDFSPDTLYLKGKSI